MPENVSKQLDRLLDALPGPIARDPGISAALLERLIRRSEWAYILTGQEQIFDQPSFPSRDGRPMLPVADPWTTVLAPHLDALVAPIASVGRLEQEVEPGQEALRGTAWLVRPDVIVTNRHIADDLRDPVASGAVKLWIDFLGEHGSDRTLRFPVTEVVWFRPYAADPNLDVAFLRIDRGAGPQVDLRPIELAHETAVGARVCTIGYPEKTGQTYKASLMLAVFNNILGVKRLGPGMVLGVTAERVLHDCTTIGGSSGSAIVDIATQEAVALNASADIDYNVAIPAWVVRKHLERDVP